jgi:hypothetical protein
MTYSDKVKQSKKVLEAMYGLKDEEHIIVSYGTDREGRPNYYKVRAYMGYKGEMSYSIHKDSPLSIDGMNIESIGRTTMKGYTYDMMSQRTNYTFPLYSMHVINK